MKKLSIRRSISLGIALGTALSVGIGLAGAAAIPKLERDVAGVERSADLTARLERLLSLVMDAETGGRGFIITGEDRYLEPFELATVELPREIAVVTSLVGVGDQAGRLNDVKRLVGRDLDLISERVRVRRVEGFDAARQLVLNGQVKATTDSIRVVLGAMQAEERKVLHARTEQSRRTTRLTRILIIISSLAALIFGLVCAFLINKSLKARETLWRERLPFFDLPLDLLGISNMEGVFYEVNAAWETTLGYSRAEVGAQPFIELVHPDDRDATGAEFQKLLAGQPTLRFQNRYLHKNGSYRDILWTAMLAPDRNAVYASGRDITELREMQTEVDRLSGMLPICAWCKNIRNDEGYWEKIEAFVRERSDAEFTHSICPDCATRLAGTEKPRAVANGR